MWRRVIVRIPGDAIEFLGDVLLAGWATMAAGHVAAGHNHDFRCARFRGEAELVRSLLDAELGRSIGFSPMGNRLLLRVRWLEPGLFAFRAGGRQSPNHAGWS